MRIVKDFSLDEKSSANELIKQMGSAGGFTAKNLAISVEILEEMIKEKKCLKFLSFPACIVATGTRGIIRDFVKRKWFDVIITTCGTLDHDLARSFKNYYHGTFFVDDAELHKRGVHRLGNVFVPKESYGMIIEKKMKEFLREIYSEKKELSTHELVWELGKRVKNKDSILFWSWKNRIPMIVPGITDGAVGYQIWQFWQDHKDLKINELQDEQLLSDLVWKAEKSGALIIGGGVSKHHVIWWNQFKEGLDYAVYITTAVEWDGSLSGARTREAISWGKIKEKARHVTVDGDATVYLPLIYSALLERIK
ncbi:MAG: deoxyhypusine synthase [Candidatus Aenigmatarchaeota archaeon]